MRMHLVYVAARPSMAPQFKALFPSGRVSSDVGKRVGMTIAMRKVPESQTVASRRLIDSPVTPAWLLLQVSWLGITRLVWHEVWQVGMTACAVLSGVIVEFDMAISASDWIDTVGEKRRAAPPAIDVSGQACASSLWLSAKIHSLESGAATRFWMDCELGNWRLRADVAAAVADAASLRQSLPKRADRADAHSRSFYVNAQRIVFSEGAAVALLKRPSDPEASQEPIHTALRRACVNNDGGAKASLTALSVDGQAAVILAAFNAIGIDARNAYLVQAQETAATLALVKSRNAARFFSHCSSGTNAGDMLAAAAAADSIKTKSAARQKCVAATARIDILKDGIDFGRTASYVDAHVQPLQRVPQPRRAGDSSFDAAEWVVHVDIWKRPILLIRMRTRSSMFVCSPRGRPLVHRTVRTADWCVALIR